MATIRDLISDAHKLLGVLPAGGTLGSAEATDGLTLVQRMLDAWNADRLSLFTLTRSTHTWTASASSRTIGATGQIVTTRPQFLTQAGVIESGDTTETPVTILTRREYADIPDKTTTSTIFTALWYEPTFPNGTATVWPVPTTAPTLVLYVQTLLTSAVALTTTLSYPPGYEEAAMYQLAKRISAYYPGTWTGTLEDLARTSYGLIRRANWRFEPMRVDPFLSGDGGHWNIETGEYTP